MKCFALKRLDCPAKFPPCEDRCRRTLRERPKLSPATTKYYEVRKYSRDTIYEEMLYKGVIFGHALAFYDAANDGESDVNMVAIWAEEGGECGRTIFASWDS